MFAANIITTFLFACPYLGTGNPNKYNNIKINNATIRIRRLDEILSGDISECNGEVIYPAYFDDSRLFLGNISTRLLVSIFILNVRNGVQLLSNFEKSMMKNKIKASKSENNR